MKKLSIPLQYAWLFLVFLFIAAPIIVIVIFSFDANRYHTIPWGGFSLKWYKAVMADQMIWSAFKNTVVVALSTGVIATILGFSAAYIDYRYKFKGIEMLNQAVAIPPAVPATILGMAMLAFLSRIGLIGTLDAIIACHTVLATSFAMAIIRLKFNEMGEEMEQAAWNMGASPLAALWKVVIPFCKPAIAAAFFISAAVSFDEFMISWFVGGMHETLPVRILNLLQGQVNPKINAIGTLVLAASFALILMAQLVLRKNRIAN